MLPEDLKRRAEEHGRETQRSLGSLVREGLESLLDSEDPHIDPLYADSSCFDGPVESNLTDAHDDYLYGEGD